MPGLVKNIGISMTGVIVASVISLALIPVVTRSYLPESIGLWQVLFSAALVLVPLATLRYESAIVIEKEKNLEGGLFATAGAMTFLIAVTCFFLFGLFKETVFQYFQLTHGYQMYVVPLVVVILSGFYMFNGVLVKQEKFTHIALLKVSSAFVLPVVALALAWLDEPNANNYLIAGCSLYLFQMISAWYFSDRRSRVEHYRSGWKFASSASAKHRDYPKYMVPYALSSSLIVQLTAGGMANLYSLAVVGAYFLALQIVNVPVTVIAAGLRNVVFSYSAKNFAERPEAVSDLIERLTLYIVLLVVPVSCLVWFFSKSVLVWFLGAEWTLAAEFSSWLIVSSTSNILTTWLDRQLEVVGKQKISVLLQVLFNIGIVLVFLLAYQFQFQAMTLVATIAIYTAVFRVGWMYFLFKYIGLSASTYGSYLMRMIVVIGVFLTLSYWIYIFTTGHDYLVAGVMLSVFLLIYGGLLLFCYRSYRKGLL